MVTYANGIQVSSCSTSTTWRNHSFDENSSWQSLICSLRVRMRINYCLSQRSILRYDQRLHCVWLHYHSTTALQILRWQESHCYYFYQGQNLIWPWNHIYRLLWHWAYWKSSTRYWNSLWRIDREISKWNKNSIASFWILVG